MKNQLLLIIALLLAFSLASSAQQLNEISTAPLSPLFRNVQLIYERQLDTMLITGVEGRYYYSSPPKYDSIKSNGGDIAFFLKFLSRKKPGGLYAEIGAILGKYNIAAGYGYVGKGWFGDDVDIITSVESRSFFTWGGKGMLGYKIVVGPISIDFSAGGKFLVLPSDVSDPGNNGELLDAWGKYRWTEFPSPGSIFSLEITAGYRF